MAKIHSLRYGDVVITDDEVLKLFENGITQYTAIYIDSKTFRKDPKPGVKKSVEIDYTFNGFRRRRSQNEGAILNFEWEITKIEYGRGDQTWDNEVYKKKPDTVTKLYYWLDTNGTFTINNENLGGDPYEGVQKEAEITYVRVKHGGALPLDEDRYTIKKNEREQAAFTEHFGYLDRTSLTVRDPWEWQKRVLSIIPGVVGGKVSNN